MFSLRSFQTRHSLLLISLMSAVILVLSVLLYSQFTLTSNSIREASAQTMEESLLTQLAQHGESMTEVLAENLVNPVYAFDMKAIEDLLAGALAQEDVSYVYVLDRDGNVLHDGEDIIPKFGTRLTDPLADEAAFSSGLLILQTDEGLDISADIETGDSLLGRVRLGMSADSVRQDISAMTMQMSEISDAGINRTTGFMIALALFLVLAAVFLSFFVSRRFLNPIQQLKIGAEEITRGNLAVRVDPKGDDEFAHLATAFNHMAEQVQEVRDRLQERTHALEQEIQGRKVLDERLREAERMDAIGRLAGGVAHDFNNQLMVIGGTADSLAMGELSAEALEQVNMIQASVGSASELTKQLLAFARKGALKNIIVDVNELIDEVASMLSRSVKKQVRISTSLSTDCTTVRGDPSQLQNCLLNLGINANDAMVDGGVMHFSTEVTNVGRAEALVEECNAGEYLKLSVRDDGKGIDDNILSHIFDPFFTTKEMGKGTGLGLSAVWGTVKGHGGFIRVERKQDNTFFNLFLPLIRERKLKSQAVSDEVITGDNKTILVIDDEAMVRKTLGYLLENLDYNVLFASSGQDGIAQLESHGTVVDKIILDLMMPGMSGTETFKKLRELDSHIPIIVASGYAVDEESAELRELDPAAILQKPISVQALSTALGVQQH